MSFYQNPFTAEFRGNWVLGDRKQAITFDCPANTGRGVDLVRSYGVAPFTLTGKDSDGSTDNKALTIWFSMDGDLFKDWATITVNLTAAASVSLQQIVTDLNADSSFSSCFTASYCASNVPPIPSPFVPVPNSGSSSPWDYIVIRQNLPATRFRFFIQSGGAESLLLFNKFAGIGELPKYFDRHTVANRYTRTDSQNALVYLDTAKNIDSSIIDNAIDVRGNNRGFIHTTVRTDYQLLEGRSGLFTFKKNFPGNTAYPLSVIEYPAGAFAGDLGMLTVYTYSNVSCISTVMQMPYILSSVDIM